MSGFFDHLDDDLIFAIESPKKGNVSEQTFVGFVEKCPKCNGTGKFTSWSGRTVGQCFACKGSGSKTFKTSKESRFQARVSSETRKVKNASENWEAFKAKNPIIADWIESTTFDFAKNMRQAIEKYGNLTDNQMAACERCVMKRESAKQASEARVQSAQVIDTTPIESAFQKASATLKKPKLRLAGFTISIAPSFSKNAGALYVKSDSGEYLGKIQAGKFFRSRECTETREQEFRHMAKNPKDAAIQYGRLTGSCACCGRTLTNKDSVELGIGPICAETYGWG